MTTVLLNLHNAGLFPAGKHDPGDGNLLRRSRAGYCRHHGIRKGNTFGTVAFCSYGLFWLSLVALLVIPKWGYWDGASKGQMMAYFFMWGLFTFLMFIGTLRINAALQFVFLSLTILFWLLVDRRGHRFRGADDDHRHRRDYLRPQRDICRDRPDLERGPRQGSAAAGRGQDPAQVPTKAAVELSTEDTEKKEGHRVLEGKVPIEKKRNKLKE